MKNFLLRYRSQIVAALFFVIAALLYLPMATRTGYYDDDWYSMYAARVGGPQILQEFYNMDSRPARAWVMIPLYILFQGNPFYYSLTAYLFRVVGALTMLWAIRLVWPANKRETFLAALLFLVYPGFLSQPVAVDFQSHLIAIWMAYLSVGLSIQAISAQTNFRRVLFWAAAVLSGWFYLGLMEYYIGFEAARLCLFAVILLRNRQGWKKDAIATFKTWIPYAVIPVFFWLWRLFIFEGQRKVTDVALQLGNLFAAPVHTLLTWSVAFLQDVANVTFLAWGVPLSQLAFSLRLRDSLIALGLSALVLILYYLVYRLFRKEETGQGSASDFAAEGLWLGSAWVLAGLVFVILANRHVVFPEYSRYGFVSAGGAVILLTAFLTRIPGRRMQSVLLGLLIVSSTVTHYANAVRFANLADDIRGFWWQVSWRVPSFEAGTTIVAHYPNGGIRETSFVWGPANQIYFPNGLTSDPVQTGIAAMLPDQSTVSAILTEKKQYSDRYYLVETYPDPNRVVILTQPTPASCVQLIDGRAPEFSAYEDSMFLVIGPYSDVEQVDTGASFREVPRFLFGPEPEHGWCYYYQKAALARQLGDWEAVQQLGSEIRRLDLRPDDLIEWFPFLEAYARAGEADLLTQLSSVIRSDRYVARQACQMLTETQGLQENILAVIDSKYCNP